MDEKAALVGFDTKDAPVKMDHAAGDDDVGSTVPGSGKIGWLGPEDPKLRNLIVLSLLMLAAFTPSVLRTSSGQPLLVVWRLSSLLCFVSSTWAYVLTKTMGARVFLYNSSGVLLAFFAHTALSPSVGVVVVQCTTHVAACLAGYALAKHRQHEGAEGSAARVRDVPAEEAAELRPFIILLAIFISVLVLALLSGVAWLVCHAADYSTEDLADLVSFTLSAVSLFAVAFTAMAQWRTSLDSMASLECLTPISAGQGRCWSCRGRCNETV